jgi:hypothetical protein
MKPNWTEINKARVQDGLLSSKPEDGFNGHFCFVLNNLRINVIASDGKDVDDAAWKWEHVSVSIAESNLPPSWSVMCQVKEIFWGDDEWVMQLHPPKAKNINNHPGVLHLWRPQREKIPLPPETAVGIKGVEPGQMSKLEMMKEYIKANLRRK